MNNLKKKKNLPRSKCTMYKTLIRPMVLYGHESWTMLEEDLQALGSEWLEPYLAVCRKTGCGGEGWTSSFSSSENLISRRWQQPCKNGVCFKSGWYKKARSAASEMGGSGAARLGERGTKPRMERGSHKPRKLANWFMMWFYQTNWC